MCLRVDCHIVRIIETGHHRLVRVSRGGGSWRAGLRRRAGDRWRARRHPRRGARIRRGVRTGRRECAGRRLRGRRCFDRRRSGRWRWCARRRGSVRRCRLFQDEWQIRAPWTASYVVGRTETLCRLQRECQCAQRNVVRPSIAGRPRHPGSTILQLRWCATRRIDVVAGPDDVAVPVIEDHECVGIVGQIGGRHVVRRANSQALHDVVIQVARNVEGMVLADPVHRQRFGLLESVVWLVCVRDTGKDSSLRVHRQRVCGGRFRRLLCAGAVDCEGGGVGAGGRASASSGGLRRAMPSGAAADVRVLTAIKKIATSTLHSIPMRSPARAECGLIGSSVA